MCNGGGCANVVGLVGFDNFVGVVAVVDGESEVEKESKRAAASIVERVF